MQSKHSGLKVIIGLGNTGMSCVRHLAIQGYNLAVVDSRMAPPGLEELRQKFPEIPVYLGSFNADILSQAEELILSPGVSITEPSIAAMIKKGVSVVGDIELFARAANAPIVAITGSNGKSTVTSLVGLMAELASKKVKVGGNLGMPALDLLDAHAELYVLELSSFQLESTYSLQATAAVILNISPDHMDRYHDLSDYLYAKQRVYRGCKIAIINKDEPSSYAGILLPKKTLSFGINSMADFRVDADYLVHINKKLLLINELKIKGLHNVANALAALALGTAMDLPQDAMREALRTFPGLPHRCQWVAEINGVNWYNDSKGTNVGAAKSAIEGLGKEIGGKVILIAGGLGKDADFAPLAESVAKYARQVVLIGKDAAKIEAALNHQTKVVYASSMQHAVEISAQLALPGDAVLLSPACASYDMFNNFQHRGEVFMAAVKAIIK